MQNKHRARADFGYTEKMSRKMTLKMVKYHRTLVAYRLIEIHFKNSGSKTTMVGSLVIWVILGQHGLF